MLAGRIFIGVLVLSMDQVHAEYTDKLLTPTQVNVLHYKGTVRPNTPFQCTDGLFPAHVKS